MAARNRVLSAFRELHRTCQTVFSGDTQALKASRFKINSEFRKFKDETDTKRIESHLQWANDSARLLRLTVVQARLKDDGSTYEMQIRKDSQLEDNFMYDSDDDVPVKSQHRYRKQIQSSNFDVGILKGKGKKG